MANKASHRSFNLLCKEYFSDLLQWWDNYKSNGGSAYPDFKHKVTKESLWIHGCYNSFCVHEAPRSNGVALSTQAQDGELGEEYKLTKVIRNFVALLRTCAKNKDLYRGTRVHNDVLKKGLLKQCSDALVTMYANCGVLAKARELLDMHKSRDIFSWTTLIAGYAKKGLGQDALNCFEEMQYMGLSPNATTFACILKACGIIKAAYKGEQIHEEIARQGLLRNDIVLGNALISMYAKCGALQTAQQVLEELPTRDVVSWSTLIAGYAQQGQGEQALNCFQKMQREGISPDAMTFACILKACGSIKAIDKGEQIHDEIARQGLLENDVVLRSSLVDMYAKCGALAKAQRVLEELPNRDVFSWSALIAGYSQGGQGEQALNCFEQMQREGLSPDAVTFACILKACGSIGAADKGEQIHDEIIRQGLLGNNIVLGNALVDMYAKCGSFAKAEQVFEDLPFRDVISWSALIAGYAQCGQGEKALRCFEKMQREQLSPNAVTFLCILKACGSIRAANKGEQIHGEIARLGLLGNHTVLGNALVDMYAKCNSLTKALGVLEELPVQNVVSWNALVTGYVQQGQAEEALNCYERMQLEGLSPDSVTFLCILKACGSIGAVDKGEQVYIKIARQVLLGNDIVLGNALVDMYSKCGAFAKAQQVLEELPDQDIVSWNALITGYVQHDQAEQALNCFERLQCEGLSPDIVTFSLILNVCGSIGAVGIGEQIYYEIARQGYLENDIVLGNAVVDMYAKCGALVKARRVLEELPIHKVVSWNALIAGYAQQGQGEQALHCFQQMQCKGLSPDAVTLLCILKACGIIGLVNDAQMYFRDMCTKYSIQLDLKHYSCMVCVLGRAGHLDKAIRVIEKMPSLDNSVALWSVLLGACQIWGDVNVGKWAFEHAVQVDESYAPAYVLMTNIYTGAGMQEDAKNIEVLRVKNKTLNSGHIVGLI